MAGDRTPNAVIGARRARRFGGRNLPVGQEVPQTNRRYLRIGTIAAWTAVSVAFAQAPTPSDPAGGVEVGVVDGVPPDGFFAANGRRPGVVTLASGLQYRVLVDGVGPSAADGKWVVLNYTGTLLNGTVFGGTRHADDRSQPESFAVAALAPGLQQAVRQMRVGARWEVYIPARLGFGRGRGEPRQRSLIYDVELVDVVAGPHPAHSAESGRQIFEAGRLPSGAPLSGALPGGLSLRGAAAACATCHRRSGFGASEGRVFVPTITGPALFAPGVFASVTTAQDRALHEGRQAHVHRSFARSAYDDTSLARALHDGVDPDGVPITAPMPRYELDGTALADLLAYLHTLASVPPAGYLPERIELATIVAADAPEPSRVGVEEVLRSYVRARPDAAPTWNLHVWRLSGPPSEWTAQLDQQMRDAPVFAVLSGAGQATWQPVQDFCDRVRLPCLFPSIDLLPDIGEGGYALYFSDGVALEAQTLAAARDSLQWSTRSAAQRWVQVGSGESGAAAARTLRAAWPATGPPLDDRAFDPGAPARAQATLHPDDALVLWLRPGEVRAFIDAVGEDGPAPCELFLSATLAPPDEVRLPAAWKARTHFVSAFDPRARQRARLIFDPWLQQAVDDPRGSRRAQLDAYAAAQLFSKALAAVEAMRLKGVRGEPGGDLLLEALESVAATFRDAAVPQYARLSLGPGQRVAVKRGIVLRYRSLGEDAPEAIEYGGD